MPTKITCFLFGWCIRQLVWCFSFSFFSWLALVIHNVTKIQVKKILNKLEKNQDEVLKPSSGSRRFLKTSSQKWLDLPVSASLIPTLTATFSDIMTVSIELIADRENFISTVSVKIYLLVRSIYMTTEGLSNDNVDKFIHLHTLRSTSLYVKHME